MSKRVLATGRLMKKTNHILGITYREVALNVSVAGQVEDWVSTTNVVPGYDHLSPEEQYLFSTRHLEEVFTQTVHYIENLPKGESV